MSLEDVRLATNRDPRCECVLLLDTSYSMLGDSIDALNDGLQAFEQDIHQNALTRRRCEIAVVTFGNEGVQVASFGERGVALIPGSGTGIRNEFFVEAGEFTAPHLTAGGDTPMGAAIERALDLVQERKQQYKDHGVFYYRPWVFLITDGEPTDSWQSAAQRVHAEVDRKAFSFFAVGVERANMMTLAQIAPSQRPPVHLKGQKFAEMFLWLSASQGQVSNSSTFASGDQDALPPVDLPPTSSWAEGWNRA